MFSNSFKRKIAKFFFGFEERSRLYYKISRLLKAGVRLQVIIDNLLKSSKERGDTLSIILEDVSRKMKSGYSFADSIKDYIPLTETLLLRSGEKSGNLAESLDLALNIVKTNKTMRSEIIGAIVQPSILFILFLVMLTIISWYVIPKIASVFDPTQWVGLASVLYSITNIVASKWSIVVFGLIFLIIITVSLSLSRWTGKFRVAIEGIPPWSLYRLFYGCGWLLSLSSLLKSGYTLLESLESMSYLAKKNKWLKERFSKTIYYFKTGKNLGEALELTRTNFPDKEIIFDLKILANLPDFDEVLYKIGQDWVNEGVEKIKSQSQILNKVALFLVAGFIILFTLGIVSLQTQIGQSFSSMGF